MRSFSILLLLTLTLNATAQNWMSPGGGVNDDIRSFYVDTVGDRLIAMGKFTFAGTMPAKGIAAWNGATWDSLHTCTVYPGQEVLAYTRYNGSTYAFGAFFGTSEQYFVQWNGTSWVPICNNIYQVASGFIEYNGSLLAYGSFDTLCGNAASKIARWDGAQWQPFDTTVFQGQGIFTAYVYNGQLFVGGNFWNANSIRNIARWNETTQTWQNVNGGIVGSFSAVGTLEEYNGELYAGGLFFSSDGNAGTCIQKWDGTSWSGVGGGMGGSAYPTVHKLKTIGSDLYAVGVFYEAGGIPAQSIAKWDGQNWCGFGSVFDNRVVDIAVYHNEIYIAPGLIIDGDTVRKVAKWIGGNYIDTCGNALSVEEQPGVLPHLVVYPNPTNGTATFEFSGVTNGTILRLFDNLGREVWRETFNDTQLILDASVYATGLYYYHVEQDGKMVGSGKLVINPQ